MAERKFLLDNREIRKIRKHLRGSLDTGTRIRLYAVLSYGTGTSIEEIRANLGCSRSSLMNWVQAYQTEGLEGLQDQRQGGNNARLNTDQLEDLYCRLSSETPRKALGTKAVSPNGVDWTVEDLYRAIKDWYGVVYKSRSSYYRLLSNHQKQISRANGNRKPLGELSKV